jgi:hypothetical protein
MYTDARGRPEIVADPSLKTGAVTPRVVSTPADPAPDPGRDRDDTPAETAGTASVRA